MNHYLWKVLFDEGAVALEIPAFMMSVTAGYAVAHSGHPVLGVLVFLLPISLTYLIFRIAMRSYYWLKCPVCDQMDRWDKANVLKLVNEMEPEKLALYTGAKCCRCGASIISAWVMHPEVRKLIRGKLNLARQKAMTDEFLKAMREEQGQ